MCARVVHASLGMSKANGGGRASVTPRAGVCLWAEENIIAIIIIIIIIIINIINIINIIINIIIIT